MSISQIQREINEWANENFAHTKIDGKLPSFSSFLGMVEELGELNEAVTEVQEVNNEEVKDALADLGVFLLDYCGRENIDLEKEWIDAIVKDLHGIVCPKLVISLGHLSKCLLKRQQMIRGYEDFEFFDKKRKEAIINIRYGLEEVSKSYGWKFEEILQETWNKVKQRNWNKNKKDGSNA